LVSVYCENERQSSNLGSRFLCCIFGCWARQHHISCHIQNTPCLNQRTARTTHGFEHRSDTRVWDFFAIPSDRPIPRCCNLLHKSFPISTQSSTSIPRFLVREIK
jgi:hypothetical protein